VILYCVFLFSFDVNVSFFEDNPQTIFWSCTTMALVMFPEDSYCIFAITDGRRYISRSVILGYYVENSYVLRSRSTRDHDLAEVELRVWNCFWTFLINMEYIEDICYIMTFLAIKRIYNSLLYWSSVIVYYRL